MSFLANYDPITDKIFNAKEGTLTWWHEKGHQRQWKSGAAQTANSYANAFFILSLACLFWEWSAGQIAFLCFFSIYVLMELDATIYAIKQKYFRRTKS